MERELGARVLDDLQRALAGQPEAWAAAQLELMMLGRGRIDRVQIRNWDGDVQEVTYMVTFRLDCPTPHLSMQPVFPP